MGLPWDSTYVLLAPERTAVSDVMRADLARDAVRVDARPAAGPQWWADTRRCHFASAPDTGSVTFQRARPILTSSQGDDPARDLAARLVALGLTVRDSAVRAVALAPEEFAAALHAGGSGGYIVAVSREPPDPCRAMSDLVARAPWLRPRGSIVPLVDTRRHVVARRAAGAFTVDWDGTLRLSVMR